MPAPAQRRRLRIVAAAVAAAMLLSLIGATVATVSRDGNQGSSGQSGPPDTERPDADVILYGDSLSLEAAEQFQGFMAADRPDARVEVTPVPGAAICDFEPALRLDLDRASPEVVVFQFAGNNSSRCVTGEDGERLTGRALASAYAEDARSATETAVESGVRVVWVGAPPSPGLPGGAAGRIDQAYRNLVDEWASRAPGQVTYAPAGEAVSAPDGGFVTHLPCLEDEGEDAGCEEGRIQVRSQDRVHFCPAQLTARGCPTYSSGARRFGEAMAGAVAEALQ